ncbi:hypothetical protein PV327_010345 [Microctonus hyperodae]|uniref:Uncharacterized protein n=1 Tax=Microctonus hyperodae TaxID=165561 RepID=A0AA39FRP4_MICHY|nr:hypothetical protein PV327_010345 [Microctonus hyperodae]
MCSAFIFNCVRKLLRDHRIIREHIRQSRENRLDEIGRKSTPCPLSITQSEIRQRGSESPSFELDSNKELIPTTTLISNDYTKEVLDLNYDPAVMNDIHQCNNVSNATQERMQETNDEPEMCDISCQTRESLFDPRNSDPIISGSPAFSTFGYQSVGNSQNGVATCLRRTNPHSQQSRTSVMQSQSNTPPSRSTSKSSTGCSPSRECDTNSIICPKHSPIPAPPGWSLHDPPYPQIQSSGSYADTTEYPSYQRYQSPKPELRNYQTSELTRQTTVGSGERYGSFLYGSGRGSSNTTSNPTTDNGSQHSGTQKFPTPDSRYRAEAVIEPYKRRHPRFRNQGRESGNNDPIVMSLTDEASGESLFRNVLLNGLPILKPPKEFDSEFSSVVYCQRRCCFHGHSHLGNLPRPAMPCCLVKRCEQEFNYRTWPNRFSKSGKNVKSNFKKCQSVGNHGGSVDINKSVWFTDFNRKFKRSENEIGASIPF